MLFFSNNYIILFLRSVYLLPFFQSLKHNYVRFLKVLQLRVVFLVFYHRSPNLNSIINLSLSCNTFFIFSINSFTLIFKSISSSMFISSFSIISIKVISLSSLSFPIGSFKYTSAPQFFCTS